MLRMIVDVLFAIALLLALWVGIGMLKRWYGLEEHGFTVGPGLIMWRTKRGLNFIDRVARISKRGWRAFGTAGAGVGFILMILTVILFAVVSVSILLGPRAGVPGAVLVIPGITIPLVYGLIGIFTVLVVHELAHGFVARAEGFRVNYTGFFITVIIPGGFVEPDEKQLKKAPVSKRLRVFGAGPFANIIFGLICFGILLLALVPKPGVYVYATAKNGPSAGLLQPGDRLLEIENIADNIVVSKVVIESSDDFYNFMENIRGNDNLLVSVERDGQKENFLITAMRHPENENIGLMGIYLTYARGVAWYLVDPMFEIFGGRSRSVNSFSHDARLPWEFIDLLSWVVFLQIGIGLFNLLPLGPIDGGQILQGVVERVSSKRTAKRVVNTLSIIVLALIIVSFVPLFT